MNPIEEKLRILKPILPAEAVGLSQASLYP